MIHISGCLLDYFDDKHAEIIRTIKHMISRNQIEIMGGAYYEPILTAVPQRDLTGQIEMMSGYIKRRFGFIPKGMWVAERVWDPALVRPLYKTGMRYLVLDDEHLLRSGIKKEDIHGYFLTGRGKEKIAVFPSDKKLRYAIPFKPLKETIDYFRNTSEKNKNILLTYGDDGEKFGEWPGTYAHVFKNQWLRNFFDALQKNKNWIKLIHFSDYIKSNMPTATLTIQQGSYGEMMGWSDGRWMNFLSKYPEANHMHKKMLYVGSKVENVEKDIGQKGIKKIEDAKKLLYKGQCNCAYWHGVFGGLYLYHLRRKVYDHLIEADKIIDKLLHKNEKKWLDIQKLDFDLNGTREVIMENRDFSIYIDPREGGVIKELDCKVLSFNLVNTLSRKKESYHQKILDFNQEAGDTEVATIHEDFRTIDPVFKNMLFYDKFCRYFLRSYFIENDLKPEDFVASSYKEIGDFSTGVYTAEKGYNGVILKYESAVSNTIIKLSKQIQIRSENEIEFVCSIKKEGFARQKALFGLEFNVTMPDLDADRYSYFADGKKQANLNTQGSSSHVSSFGISDAGKELSISFHFSRKPAHILYFPVKTISQSERAYELNYQCSCIFPLWNLDLEADGERTFNVNFILGRG